MSYRRSISTIGRVSITVVEVVSNTIVITTLREFFIDSRIRPYEPFLYVR